MASTDPQSPQGAINVNYAVRADDPFAAQRKDEISVENGREQQAVPASPVDRKKKADEWDASKTPPSRFQQRQGSIYATPGSRDAHTDKNKDRDKPFHDKVKEFGSGLWGKRRKSSSTGSDSLEKKVSREGEETK